MWVVSAFVFLANPLLGAVLLMSAAVTTGLKIAKVDTEYAKHGKTPPSYALVEKWLDRRKAAGKAPKSAKVAKPGMWRYAWQRWQAMWEDLTEQHREVRDQYKTAVADAKANGKPLPPKPTVKETLKGWQWQIDQLTAPAPPAVPVAAGAPPADVDDPAEPRPAGETASKPDETEDFLAMSPPRFNPEAPAAIADDIDRRSPGAVTPAAPDDGVPATPGMDLPPPRYSTTEPEEPSRWRPAWDTDDPDAVLIDPNYGIYQFDGGHGWKCQRCGTTGGGFADPRTAAAGYGRHVPICPATAVPPNEGDPMTQAQSGEVTGIPSAVHYMNQVAATHTQHAGNEQILTAMNTMKIGPGDISLVQQAQEASRNAADLWTTAGDTIEQHNAGVREGYASAPDAADKHAQMAE